MPRTTPLAVLAACAALAFSLVGCTASPQDDDAGSDDAAAFVACLRAAGVEAQVGERGHALVRQDDVSLEGEPGEQRELSFEIDSSGTGAQVLWSTFDDEGLLWVAAEHAAYFADDPDTQDAYAVCEADHPDFAQPAELGLDDPEVKEQLAQQRDAGLTFAQCARDAGFSWVTDPSESTGNGIALPIDLTEDEFRALLTACYRDELSGIGWYVDSPNGELNGFDFVAVLDEFTATPAG